LHFYALKFNPMILESLRDYPVVNDRMFMRPESRFMPRRYCPQIIRDDWTLVLGKSK